MWFHTANLAISLNTVFFLVGGVIFYITTVHSLSTRARMSTGEALLATTLIACGGTIGALLYGIPGANAFREASATHLRFSFALGSFGGYWGVLLAAYSIRFSSTSVRWSVPDCCVSGMLLGGALARFPGIVDANAVGVAEAIAPLPWIWSTGDVLLHLAVLFLLISLPASISNRRWVPTVLFLFCYGAGRALLELLRDDSTPFETVTLGFVLSLLQIALSCFIVRKEILPPNVRLGYDNRN